MVFAHIQFVVNLLMELKNYVIELDIQNIKQNIAEISFRVIVNMVLVVNFYMYQKILVNRIIFHRSLRLSSIQQPVAH